VQEPVILAVAANGEKMAKERGETHLSEDASESLVKSLLPKEWVMRKLHPDYGVDVTIDVFERTGSKQNFADCLGNSSLQSDRPSKKLFVSGFCPRQSASWEADRRIRSEGLLPQRSLPIGLTRW
jgi:hypothetical protein